MNFPLPPSPERQGNMILCPDRRKGQYVLQNITSNEVIFGNNLQQVKTSINRNLGNFIFSVPPSRFPTPFSLDTGRKTWFATHGFCSLQAMSFMGKLLPMNGLPLSSENDAGQYVEPSFTYNIQWVEKQSLKLYIKEWRAV